MSGVELPLKSCYVFAALCRAPPVCCEPALHGCARPAAGPSPSSLGEASSGELSSASDHCDAPPAAKAHTQCPIIVIISFLWKQTIALMRATIYFLFLLSSPLFYPLTSSACFLMMACSFSSGESSLFRLCINSIASFPEQPYRI